MGNLITDLNYERNHHDDAPRRQMDFMRSVSEAVPATYGVCYMFDEEVPEIFGMKFIVLKLCKGIVKEVCDILKCF